jgi:hypothetical protein
MKYLKERISEKKAPERESPMGIQAKPPLWELQMTFRDSPGM